MYSSISYDSAMMLALKLLYGPKRNPLTALGELALHTGYVDAPSQHVTADSIFFGGNLEVNLLSNYRS